ncbi:MAG: PilW family protein [Halioglobus sp.]
MNRFGSHALRTRQFSVARPEHSGFSLIELLIATALGLIIVAALTTLFGQVSRTNLEMAKTNSQIENARFAMQFLQNDLIHAGYWNAFVPEFDDLSFVAPPSDYPGGPADPCKAVSTWTAADHHALLGIVVEVYDDTLETPAHWTCTFVDDRLPDTDLLVVRHADTCAAGTVGCEAVDPNELYFQASNCAGELDLGNMYALDPNAIRKEMDCMTNAAKRKFVQTIYYIRDYAVSAGDNIPTLVRSQFGWDGSGLVQQPVQALVEGIERFRVELGLDLISETVENADPNSPILWLDPDEWRAARNRGDGIPESFDHCVGALGCTVAELTSVAAVRLYVLARANEATAGYVDNKSYQLGGSTVLASALPAGFKRHVFSTTVRLNNVSARRETPP